MSETFNNFSHKGKMSEFFFFIALYCEFDPLSDSFTGCQQQASFQTWRYYRAGQSG